MEIAEEMERKRTVRQVAAHYQVHDDTVRRWIRTGAPATSIGGAWRLDIRAVEAWLRERGHGRRGR